MYQWRDIEAAGSGAGIVPRGQSLPRLAAPPFGQARAPKRLSLVVDLGEDLFSAIWWRGAGTLALLCSGAAMLAPQQAALASGHDERLGFSQAKSLSELGVAPARMGARSGGRMAASDAVRPLLSVPERSQVDLTARLGAGDRIGPMLMRLGATAIDAIRVDAMVRGAAPQGIEDGTPVAIRLGAKDMTGRRPVTRVQLRATMAMDLVIEPGASGLVAHTTAIPIDTRPQRIRGRVGDGLYWSLRGAGVSSATAADYLKALATQVDVGALGQGDRFDLIVANRRSAEGVSKPGPLLYAGIERGASGSIQLLKWTVEGRTGWYEASSLKIVSGGGGRAILWPVNARITSGFGMRRHPILGYARMHKGLDFGAHWGSPIVAAADGVVSGAGWAGGYGQQVRLNHDGGVATSYSHMSRIVIQPGTLVRQGQLIGYVGSTGLSTGPHLHFEATRHGAPIDPRGMSIGASERTVDNSQLVKFRARLKALLGSARG